MNFGAKVGITNEPCNTRYCDLTQVNTILCVMERGDRGNGVFASGQDEVACTTKRNGGDKTHGIHHPSEEHAPQADGARSSDRWSTLLRRVVCGWWIRSTIRVCRHRGRDTVSIRLCVRWGIKGGCDGGTDYSAVQMEMTARPTLDCCCRCSVSMSSAPAPFSMLESVRMRAVARSMV